MKPRLTLSLVLAAAILGGGYWYWEVKSKPARDAAKEDAKRVFPGLQSAGTGEILLRLTGKPEVLLRKIADQWHLITPVQALADPQAVEGLLTQLKDVKRDEVVDEKATDLRKYGLDQPSGAVTFKPVSGDAKAQVLFFGMDSFDGTKAYGMVDGQTQVFLTELASKTALLKDADGLREKHLLTFDPAAVQSVRGSAGGGFTLERNAQGAWQVRAGARVEPADVEPVDAWLKSLQDVKADKVMEEAPKNPGKYGLGGAHIDIALKGQPTLSLQKGKLDGKGPAFYARLQGLPQVWLVPGSVAGVFEKTGVALMNLRAFDLRAGLVDHFSVWQNGTTLTARRKAKDLKWAWEAPYAPKPGEAAFNFEDFIAKVAGTERLSKLPDSARPAKPLMVLAFYGAQDQLLDQAYVGPKQGQGQVVQSSVKKSIVLIPTNVFEGIPVPPTK